MSPTGERVSLAQLTKSSVTDGGSEIYREANSRYVAVKFSVRGRDLGSTVEEAIRKVNASVKLPQGYTIDWAGEYESQKRSQRRLMIVLPVTIVAIFVILYAMFASVKWSLLILTNVAMAPLGGLLALLVTHTNLSVSSGVGFLALFGVSVQTGVIMVEYINQLRARGYTIEQSAAEGAVLRLRPIMMTMLVATLGLLPAALSRGIGSDSQRPFAIVIVGRPSLQPYDRDFSSANAVYLVCARRRSSSRGGFRRRGIESVERMSISAEPSLRRTERFQL